MLFFLNLFLGKFVFLFFSHLLFFSFFLQIWLTDIYSTQHNTVHFLHLGRIIIIHFLNIYTRNSLQALVLCEIYRFNTDSSVGVICVFGVTL